jgi:hypothetical protein
MKKVLLGLLLASSAEAQQLRVLALGGEGALSGAELAEVVDGVTSDFRQAGLDVRTTKIIRREVDPCDANLERSNFPWQFECYERLGLALRRFRYGPTLVVSAPMRGGGERFLGGVARRDCFRRHISRRISWAAATGSRVTGETRIPMSIVLAAHEVAHNLGATHYDGRPNIMHSTALVFVKEGQILNFVPRSADEMRSCPVEGGLRR